MSTNSNLNRPRVPKRVIVLGAVLLVLAVALFFALMGRSTVTGAFPASVKTGSAVCSKDKFTYPYTEAEDKATDTKGDMRVVATFDQSKVVQRIALDYTVYYPDNKSAVVGEAVLHGNLGVRFNNESIPYDEFSNKFSVIDKKVTLSLIADLEKVDEKNYKYLLLSKDPGKSLTLAEFRKTFEGKGYKCTTSGE